MDHVAAASNLLVLDQAVMFEWEKTMLSGFNAIPAFIRT